MDFNNLKDSFLQKGKDELSQRGEQLAEGLKQRLGGGSKPLQDGENSDPSPTAELSASSSKEIVDPTAIEKDTEIQEPEDVEKTTAEADDVDAVSDGEAVSADEEKEEAA